MGWSIWFCQLLETLPTIVEMKPRTDLSIGHIISPQNGVSIFGYRDGKLDNTTVSIVALFVF
jgi:hypothetical protein